MKPEKCTNSVVSLQDLCSYKAPTTNCHINNKKKTHAVEDWCESQYYCLISRRLKSLLCLHLLFLTF